MQLKKHIFEIKAEMNATGWSCITAEQFDELDFFTKQFVMDTVENKEDFDTFNSDIVLGNGCMFCTNEEAEF